LPGLRRHCAEKALYWQAERFIWLPWLSRFGMIHRNGPPAAFRHSSIQALPMWEDDPIFSQDATGGRYSPCFRLCAYFPYKEAHPYVHTDAFEELFACFAPVLKERCDRIRMWDRPGASARRGTKIKPEDWAPFRHLKSVYSDVEHGVFTGFYFINKAEGKSMDGGGPCAFRYFVYGSGGLLDICVPLEDWRARRIDISAALAALHKIPLYSFLGGYGLSLAETYREDELIPIAQKYPALDLAAATSRHWLPGGWPEQERDRYWIAGINWLTGIGAPFLSMLGGAAALVAGLPAAIEAKSGPHNTIFQLGPAPVTGEAGADDASLPLYHALGKKLRPPNFHVKDKDLESAGISEPYNSFGPVFGPMKWEESLAWARRFYDAV
jgi:hypothetical protein